MHVMIEIILLSKIEINRIIIKNFEINKKQRFFIVWLPWWYLVIISIGLKLFLLMFFIENLNLFTNYSFVVDVIFVCLWIAVLKIYLCI